jgi:4-amino-4-deoxychorismate lyase
MLLNGQPASGISLHDRGLAYGDGLFETILVHDGHAVLLDLHLQRLQEGCGRLGLAFDDKAIRHDIKAVLAHADAANSVLKLMLVRKAGGRGYRPATDACNRIVTVHPKPLYSGSPEQGIAMFLCQQRLARQPALAGLKHLNRLEQVMASREWPDETYQEGLMLDTHDLAIEGTRSNLFAVIDGKLVTPRLDQCGVDGVLRRCLLQHFGARSQQVELALPALKTASELFVCNGVFGVWPVIALQLPTERWHYTVGDMTREATNVFSKALRG